MCHITTKMKQQSERKTYNGNSQIRINECGDTLLNCHSGFNREQRTFIVCSRNIILFFNYKKLKLKEKNMDDGMIMLRLWEVQQHLQRNQEHAALKPLQPDLEKVGDQGSMIWKHVHSSDIAKHIITSFHSTGRPQSSPFIPLPII